MNGQFSDMIYLLTKCLHQCQPHKKRTKNVDTKRTDDICTWSLLNVDAHNIL